MRISPINLNLQNNITKPAVRRAFNNTTSEPKFTGRYSSYPDIYYIQPKDPDKTPFQEDFENLVEKDSKNAEPFVQYIKNGFTEKIEKKLEKHPEQGIIIGITGKSAAGKTTLTEKFVEKLKEKGIDVTVINADQYFEDTSELVKKAGSFPNLIASGYEFDAPDNFRLDLLALHLVKLSDGKTVKSPRYLGDGTGRCPINMDKKNPQKIIIVEGLAAHYPSVRDVVDAKVFINIDENLRKQRFVERAPWRHPDWTYNQIISQYNETTKAADKYILPQLNGADVVLNSGADYETIDKFIDGVADTILDLRKSRSQKSN